MEDGHPFVESLIYFPGHLMGKGYFRNQIQNLFPLLYYILSPSEKDFALSTTSDTIEIENILGKGSETGKGCFLFICQFFYRRKRGEIEERRGFALPSS